MVGVTRAEQAAENATYFVIPSGARNPSFFFAPLLKNVERFFAEFIPVPSGIRNDRSEGSTFSVYDALAERSVPDRKKRIGLNASQFREVLRSMIHSPISLAVIGASNIPFR